MKIAVVVKEKAEEEEVMVVEEERKESTRSELNEIVDLTYSMHNSK